MHESFVLYAEIIEVLKVLTNEQKGILFQKIVEYANGLEPEFDDPVLGMAFINIKLGIDRNNSKWEKTKEARSKAGKKGMQNRWDDTSITNDNKNNNVTKPITNDNKNNNVIDDVTNITDVTNVTVNVNDNVNVNGNVNVIEKKSKKEKFSDDETLQESYEAFVEMRKQIKHPLTERASKMLKKKLNEMSEDPLIQARILDQSTFHCWQGVFELKGAFATDNTTRGKPTTRDPNEGLEKCAPPPDNDEEWEDDNPVYKRWKEDNDKHPVEDGWRTNDDGYWIKLNVV